MRKPARVVATASAVVALMGSLALSPQLFADQHGAKMSMAELGKKVAENRRKGNCFACHAYQGVDLPGNIGPPLVAMKARFPDRANLRAQVWDATVSNPDSLMPPFGRHQIISDKEVDQIVEWLYTL